MRFVVLGLFMVIQLWGVNFQDFDAYQGRLTKEEIENKIRSYLEKDPKIRKFYKITEEALYIGDWSHQQVDYTLRLMISPSLNPSKKASQYRSLKGARIALDPGHLGGIFAKLEDRYIDAPPEEAKSPKPLSFDEGTLAYLTAIELQSLLQQSGADVLITRPGIGTGALRDHFFKWLEKQSELWNSQEALPNLFRIYYNRADLLARAEKINTFHPDITIIIHYNADDTDWDKDRKPYLTQANYNMAFIPGAFRAEELTRAEDRYEFLRLIVTDHLAQSLTLAEKIVEQFVQQLHIPLVTDRQKLPYLEHVCLKQKTGIYSRNLALTRLVHSPLCYGETLVQNNWDEYRRLAAHDTEIAGMPCSSRIKEVARAYYEGIKAYFEHSDPR